MSSGSSWTHPRGYSSHWQGHWASSPTAHPGRNSPTGFYSPELFLDEVQKYSQVATNVLPYTSYYDTSLPANPPPSSLGLTNVVAEKGMSSFDYVMAINWSISNPPLSRDYSSCPVTPDSCMTASPPPNIVIPQSIFPTYAEQHLPLWEPVQATRSDSPSLAPLTTGRDPSTSPMLLTVPFTSTDIRQPSRKAQTLPPGFLHTFFPLDSEAHGRKREALEQVMTADWKIKNQMEPHESLLLDFMRLDSQRNRWTCTFYTGGVPCGSSYKKKDQAKGHIRFHLQHFPYACLDAGPCPIKGKLCRKRYCAAEPRQKHRAIKTKCLHCGKPMLRGNVKRHRETACTRQMTTSASSPESSSASSPSHD